MLFSREETLKRIILAHAPSIQPRIPWANAVALLGALAENESSFGANAIPKYEKQFDYGGRFYARELCKKWGAWAACSYGSFQIMYPVAVELGFDPNRSPAELWDDEVGIHWVIEYINRRIIDRGAASLRDFAAAYNGGNPKAWNNQVAEYAQRFDLAYAGVIKKRELAEIVFT